MSEKARITRIHLMSGTSLLVDLPAIEVAERLKYDGSSAWARFDLRHAGDGNFALIHRDAVAALENMVER